MARFKGPIPTEPAERLARIREARGYEVKRWAPYAMIGMDPEIFEPTYIGHENAQRRIPEDYAKVYADFFGVSRQWLLTGAGPDPFADGDLKPHDPELIDAAKERAAQATRDDRQRKKERDAKTANGPRDGAWDLERISESEMHGGTVGRETGVRGIPKGAIAQLNASGGMGGGGLTIINDGVPGKHGMTFSAEAISDYWRLPSSILSALSVRNEDVIVLPVKGNSMAPVLLEGDFLFVDTRHRWPSPDGIYALADDFDEIIVKTIRMADPEGEEGIWVEIHSENPSYKPRRKRAEEIRIIGRVIRRFSAVF